MPPARKSYPITPDGRYFVVAKRLWRCSNPNISDSLRRTLVLALMAARRAVRDANGDKQALARARAEVNKTKIALGERGPPWWTDGAPDYNRHLVKTTPYAGWFRTLGSQE